MRLLLWLSDPATAVATASGVLAEALPALRLMAADEAMQQVLAAADGPHEREPVAVALRRRLPRRMAARFLPEVDRVLAAVAGRDAHVLGGTSSESAAIVAAEAAMAELLQVRAIHSCSGASKLIRLSIWHEHLGTLNLLGCASRGLAHIQLLHDALHRQNRPGPVSAQCLSFIMAGRRRWSSRQSQAGQWRPQQAHGEGQEEGRWTMIGGAPAACLTKEDLLNALTCPAVTGVVLCVFYLAFAHFLEILQRPHGSAGNRMLSAKETQSIRLN